MPATIEMEPMIVAKKPSAQTYEPVKIRVDVLDRARKVAKFRGVDLQDYLSELLAPIVQKDWADELKAAQEAARRRSLQGRLRSRIA
jgi:hypothetical protein